MTPDSLVVKPERRTSSLSPPPVHHPPSQTDPATAIGPRMPSLADRKPLLKFSVSAILAKKGEEDSDRAALIKEESTVKEEKDAEPFVYGKQPHERRKAIEAVGWLCMCEVSSRIFVPGSSSLGVLKRISAASPLSSLRAPTPSSPASSHETATPSDSKMEITKIAPSPAATVLAKPVANRPPQAQPMSAAAAAAAAAAAPLFSSHLQSLLYRHTYLSTGNES